MLSNQELQTLFDVISDTSKTFESALLSFQKHFHNKAEQFKACCTLSYLLENNLLSKCQRIISFYILFELYHHEQNVQTTPFESCFLSSIQYCLQALNPQREFLIDDNQWKCEFNLLTQILISLPKIQKQEINQYILDCEKNKDPIQNQISDIKSYIQIHEQNMPKIQSYKQYAVSGLIRDPNPSQSDYDLDEDEELVPPEFGIPISELTHEELMGQYLIPNWLRPLPKEEVELDENQVEEQFVDGKEGIWLVPGIRPEPFWDLYMGFKFNFKKIQNLLYKCPKMQLNNDEIKMLQQGLSIDPEFIYHASLTPNKLPSIINNNSLIASDILICLNNNQIITKFYDALSQMKVGANNLEVFNRLSSQVELPQVYFQFFIRNCINQCMTSQDNKVNKNRMIRLVCVFLNLIIKNGQLANQNGIFLEIESFCTQFSDVKEASQNLKLIQSENQKKK